MEFFVLKNFRFNTFENIYCFKCIVSPTTSFISARTGNRMVLSANNDKFGE